MAVIPIIIPIQRFPYYIKKKELEKYLKKQEKQIRLVSSCVIAFAMLLQLFLAFLILPKLSNVYSEVGINQPNYLSPLVFLSIVVGVALLAIGAILPALDSEKIKELEQQKDEMITISSSLINNKIQIIYIAYLVLASITILVSIVFPIQKLISSV